MVRIRGAIGAAVLAVAVAVAPATPGHASADGGAGVQVIGGETVGSASWGAQLFWDDWFGCSGTLIASRWVLTARHCVDEQPTHVLVGNVRRGEGTRANVSRMVVSGAGDMALLRLARAVNRTPARLADAAPPVGATSFIYGWGTTEVGQGQPVSDVLKRAAVRMEGLGSDAFGGPALQGVWVTGTAGYGDSGGPQMYRGAVVGVCSTGDYVRVWYGSVAVHRDWIRSVAGV